MKTLKIVGFEIFANTDMTEGKGFPVSIGFASNLSTADKIAEGRGVFGSKARVEAVNKEIIVFDNYEEYLDSKKENKIKNTLDKLNKEEIKLLGLEDFKQE